MIVIQNKVRIDKTVDLSSLLSAADYQKYAEAEK